MADMAAAELAANHGTLFAIVANRVDADEVVQDAAAAVPRAEVPAYAIPEEPLLAAPSVADLMSACDGTLVSGDAALLDREATGLVVAAMTMPNVLDRLIEGAVVITPGDRPEVVLGVLMAHLSASFPPLSCIVLNGGFELPPQVTRLLDGARHHPADHRHRARHPARPSALLTSVRGRLDRGLAAQDRDRALALFADACRRPEPARSPGGRPHRGGHPADVRVPAARRGASATASTSCCRRATTTGSCARRTILLRRGVADLTLLGDDAAISARAASIGVDLSERDRC